MVAVVIDYADAACPSAQLKTPVHTTEFIQSLANVLDCDVETDSHGDSRRSVQHVMDAGHVQTEFAEVATTVADLKTADRLLVGGLERRFLQLDLEILASACAIRDYPS